MNATSLVPTLVLSLLSTRAVNKMYVSSLTDTLCSQAYFERNEI